MAQIVGGFLIPHDPLMSVNPEAERAETAWRCFSAITERLRALEVDTIITVGNDHFGIFGPHCVPQCLIGIGDVDGPLESWLGIEPQPLPNHEALALHILNQGHAEGINWAFAKSITVDHATMVPYHFCFRSVRSARVIPVYLNAAVAPYIPSAAARAIGQGLGRAVECWPGAERVAVFGTGGCSHWVGMPDMGRVNEAFDHRLMSLVEAADIEGLIALSDEEILAEGGNGALEIKNWICAMAAMPAVAGRLLAYEPMPEWISGIAFAELSLAA